VELPPRRFSKPGASDAMSQGSDGMGPLRDQAIELLQRMQDGTCTSGDVARLAADVLANPPPVIAAAQRYLREVGGQHEGSAAVELLSLVVGEAVFGQESGEGVS
jgi:hypothetical protein